MTTYDAELDRTTVWTRNKWTRRKYKDNRWVPLFWFPGRLR